MEIIRRRAYARAGLIGNPSDGYNGKTIAVLVPNYFAEVVLYEWKELEIVPSQDDQSKFSSIENLATDVQLHGYYGGIRLVKATIKRFKADSKPSVLAEAARRGAAAAEKARRAGKIALATGTEGTG